MTSPPFWAMGSSARQHVGRAFPARAPSGCSRPCPARHLLRAAEPIRLPKWPGDHAGKKIAKNYWEVHVFVCLAAAFGNEIVLFLSSGNKRIDSRLMEPGFGGAQ